jgi:hypothetical protein
MGAFMSGAGSETVIERAVAIEDLTRVLGLRLRGGKR